MRPAPLLPLALAVTWTLFVPPPATASLPFQEVYDLISTNLPSLTPDELNALAVDGLLERLGARARLVDGTPESPFVGELIASTRQFPGGLGYVRLGEVSGGVAPRLAATLAKLGETNSLQGLVLDLRFAGGRDFATAARVAELFFAAGEPVLDWGEGPFPASSQTNRFTRPVAVLVNAETRGSAEAVAAALRNAGLALVIGGSTAGEAALQRDFPLSDGRKLRLAVTPVKTGDGQPIPPAGLTPDIPVTIAPGTERRFLDDPSALVRAAPVPADSAASTTNEVVAATRVRRRLNEAELIRAKQESLGQAESTAAATNTPPPGTTTASLVRDPALARGLDFLQGLNAVRGN